MTFIEKSGGINARNDLKQTALHRAAGSNNSEIVKILIEKGSDINALDYSLWTPLHYSARYNNNAEVLQTLIEKGAEINALNNYQ